MGAGKLLCLRENRTERSDVFLHDLEEKQASWAREHLVDFERSEQIYLVIRGFNSRHLHS